MNEIKENNSLEKNNPNSTEKTPKDNQSEIQNKIHSQVKVKISLPNKKDLSNEILYFSINQESK